ncbi:MAG: competence/damage-inducible protein A [Thermaerobacterales bacterium]
MRADLIFVGTELLLGEILNTNAQYLSRRLAQLGVDVYVQTVVGDNLDRLSDVLADAVNRSDVVITTGGLGPTMDDLTRDAVARVIGRGLVEDPVLIAELEKHFERRGVPMTENNRRQACLPEGASPVPNRNGTAPGISLRHAGCLILCLPGPPRELMPMFEDEVAPRLLGNGKARLQTLYSRVLKVVGMGESAVEHLLSDLVAGQSDPTIAPYAKSQELHLRLATKASDEQEAEARFAPLETEIRRRLGRHLYGRDDETLEEITGRELVRRGLVLALAESCTGGLIGHRITNVAGSSDYFLMSLVAYDNRVKEQLLGVPAAVLAAHGAVSAETAAAMAEGALARLRSCSGMSNQAAGHHIDRPTGHVTLAVTGIAGPGGGTADKPVGTVFCAAAGLGYTVTLPLALRGSRSEIKHRSATMALNLLREYLLDTNS